ncbi:Ig-like domain-containing protein [Rahnella victoriana]|uniref:Ig-like domain-containing protein n=1 Tax=Rahnella victoriana TaxID=1510570 RepID=UPI00103DD3FB|nr:Ig-like domain-containing protein [Rahnella victoriana]TBX36116.1 Ig-like domain-containing protein [Rahnella victoriana]
MRKTMDIISRKTSLKNEFTAQGNTAVAMNESGIVVIHDSVKNVASYERSGNDLIIHMQDGSVIRCVGYFENIGEKDENKLVFQDGKQELTEVTFTDAAVAHDAPVFALHAVETPLAGIESLLLSTTEVTVEWPYLLGGALGVGAVGALLAHGGGSDEKTKVIDNTKAVEVAQPTFLVTDTQGDSQGILANQAVTDDTRPTFTGTGYPGADIAIVDASGNIIATALVDSNGQWTAQLAPQAAGSHTYIVVQESNGSTTSAGSITLTVVTAKASLSIDTMAGDNVLNAAEAGSDVAISGKSDNLAAGTTVTVSLNGTSWQTTVGADGTWAVKVPAADAQALADGVYTVQVSGVDRAGNTITSSSSLAVDTHAPSLTIATLAGDDMLNAAEAGKDLTLSGTSDAGAGRVVTLNLNGQTYTATVGADGNWSATVPAAQAGALADGNVTISASVSDAAGNSTSTTHDLRVDTTVPVVTIDTIAGDNILNSAEQTQAQIVSGTSTGGEAGDTVTLLVNGQTYTTTLTADGSWSIGLPASVFSSVADGSYTVSVSITDKAGNTGSQSTTVLVSSEVPELAINTVATDDIINALEKGNALEISGTSNSADGTPVSLTLNGVTYSGTVSGGHWSVTVPASDVSKLGEATYTLSASSTDAEGNSGAATHNVVVDSVLPTVSIAVTAGDNIINATEIDTDQTLSGKVANAAAGDVVTVTVGGNIYTTAVQDDLSWSVSVPSADLKGFGDGDLTISASVTNQHGNTGSADRDIAIDAGLPGLRLDTVAGDDIVNSIEIQQNQIISGTSTDIAAGSSVTVTVNGVDYQATVGANGTWSAAVPAADVANWPAGQLAISVTGSDTSGNSVTISNNVTVDLSSVAISVDTIAADDMINAAEKAADLTLTGTTQNVEAGQTVTVNFAGHNYTTTVQANGGWSVTVPAGDMTSLKDGDVTATASVTNVAGNSASAANTAEIDASAPAITINTIAGDNVLNSAEAGADVVLSGTSTAEAGQVVTVTVNGNDYTATVGTDGTWSTSVPAADAAALADGTYSVIATVQDVAGNSSSATGSVLVDVTAPTLSINTVSTDDVINAQELQQNLMITGSSTGVPAGGLVTVDIDGHSYTAAVDANGNWSVGVPADVVSTLTDGSYTVSASVKDAAGNDGSVTHDVTVDTVSPVLTINTVAADDVINAIEKGEALTVSGTSDGADGSTVTLNFNGTNYTATVSNGAWTLDVPATDVAKLGEADYTLTASSTDAAGNTGNTSHVVLVDSALPTVSISPVATDNVINSTEINADQLIGGKVTNAAAGDVVTITLGGNTYTATVQDDLSWGVSVPSADLKGFGDGDLTVSASVTNQHGNSGNADRDIAIDAGLPGLRLDTVAGDDVVNSIEIQQNQIISGTSTDIAAGSSVTVTVNGVDYQATVGANGAWSAAVPAADVANWPAGQLTISVTGSDTSGNSVTISNNVTVDLSSVAISVDTIAVDDMINAAEKAADLTLTGSTQNVEAGQTVTVNFAGHTYTTTVQSGGSWSVTVPAGDMTSLKDGDVTATASVTNVAGNSATAANTAEVDASAPTLTINTIAGDNVLNLAEAGADVVLSGTSTAEAGQVVTVTVNGNDYTATVGTDGTWSTSVPAADAQALTDGTYSVTATVKDVAGNSSSATGSLLVDVTAPTLSINTVSTDDVINAQELQQNLMISGGSTGVPAGGLVTVEIDGHSYTAAVDANGNWSVGVPADVVSTLTDGGYTVTASVKDAAGNDGSVTHDVTVDTVSPVLTINTVAADDVINAIEKGEALTVSGTSDGTDGSTVTLNFNGQNYTATVSNGAWTLDVPATDVAKLGEADYTLTASSTDAAGNTGNTSHTVLVDSALPTVSISPVATDNVINATEINADQLIGGTVTNAAAGDVVTITLGGNTYTATVQDDLSWGVSVPSADLKGFGDGDLTISASVTNQHGNTGSADRDIAIDAGLPGLRIDTVAGDDIVNSIEIQQNQIISGTSTDIAEGNSVTVTVNGVDYQATVGANGAWSAAVPAADVANWPAGQLAISVTGSDTSGNSVTISNNVTVDLSSVAISVDTIAADDMINAAEKAADLTLTGTTQNVEAGQTVTVNFAGHSYTTTVQSGGSWSVTVPAGDMTALKDGDVTATASVTNVAGNSATAANTAEVDASAPAITINTIAGDNVLNSAEAGADVVLSGTSTAEAGQVVTVTVNGNDYTATVGTDGTWSTSVPAADAAALTDGTYSVIATVQDVAGNSSSATGSVLVDVTAPTLSINTLAADDVINAQELQQNLMITGSSTGVPAGGLVTVDIDGHSYTAAVDANGNWSVGVPADVVSTLTDGSYTVTASVKDAAGNDGSVTHDVTVDTVSPVLSINTVAADDVINAIEKGEALTVSGTSDGADGSTVTLNFNGTNYTATVSTGAWTLDVPATDVAKLGEADYTLTASSTDAAGNTGSASHSVLVDSALPTVSISPVASDNVINATEINADQLIGGTVTNAAAGDVVTITLGGNTYTATVQDDLSWSVSVPSADLQGFGDGDLTVSASVTNQHGNTGSADRDIAIDAGLPGLRIDTVAGDDIVNSIEIQQNQIISGTSTDIAAGSSVTVTVNGVDYQATVGANGAWSAAIPSADVANWPAGQLTISVTGSDTSGNSVTISNNVTVDLSSVAISVDTIAADDMINAAEKAADLTLTGSTQNVEAGQMVTVNFAGHTYTTTVQANGGWSVTVPAGDMTSLKDGDVTATASVTNVAGNSASAANTAEVDASAPTITINTIAGDNVLNSAEAGADVVLSGTSTAEAGQVVTVTVNGNDYTATVGTDGSWSTAVPAADAQALTDGTYSVSATVKDVAGNSSSATGSLLVDVTAPTLSINAVSTDDVINAQELQQNLMITGSSTGVPAGGLVTVEIDGHSYTAAVDANGNWSVGVPANVVSTLTDGSYTVSASVKDAAGNDGSITHDVTVDTVAPVLTINTVAADDVINAIEKGEALTVSGTSNGADGSVITLNLNGQNYAATVSNGAWTLNVPASDVAKLGEADYTLTASSTDAAGNTGSATHDVLVDSSLPSVSISPVATDNIVNATEINADQTISGKVTNAAAGDTVTLTLGGKTYTAEVQSDLSWSVSVPSADLKGFGDGDLTISASVTNQHGNTGSADREINIDAGLPGLRIDTVAGDDVINSIEIQQNQIVSGTSTDIAAGSSVTVTINGVDYQATVGANGAWSAAVPAADVANWPAGQLAISVTGSDTSGNSVTISNNVTVDLSSVAISVDTIATDDMINAAEKAADLTLTGTTQNVEAGQTVTVNFAGHTYTTTVQSGGSWSVTVPAGDMTALKDGDVTATASVTNVAGNSATAANTAEVDASAPTVTIQTISASDVLNAINTGTEVTLSGTSTAQAGQTVTITLGSETYTATVAADGTWTTGVPDSVFSGLGDGSYTLTASVSDIAGNPATATGTAQVDLTAPVVTINTVAGDDVINSTEHGQAQVISGTVTGVDAGSVVTVTINNVDYRAVSDGSGNWSVGVPANVVSGLNDGSYTLTAKVTDTAGNTGSANRDVTVETTAPVFVINDMAGGDNILNAAEAQTTLTVTGTVTGLADGATVIVTLNGLNYQGTVSGGVWSADIPASDLANLGQALYQVSVSGTDVYGNNGSSAKTLQTSSDSPAVTINTVAGDDIINATEITQDQVISGTVTHAEAGQTVTVTVGGKTYTAEVQNDLSWSLTVPAADLVAMGDGSLNIAASVTNTSGNSGSGERDITIDAAIPGLRIDTIAGDDIVNSIEINQNQIVSGTSTGLAAGSSVTVTINGVDYAATVGAGGKWSAAVPAADVANWPAGELTVSVSGTSSAGNSVTISHDITVDLSSVSIAIDTVSTDNMLNAAEKAADLTLSGTTQNVEAGQTVTVIFAGHSYTAQVQTGGAWSLTVPAADMSNLKDGDAEIRVSVTNTAGNSASAAQDVTVDTVAPTITLNTVAGDNVLNLAEASADVIISGTTTAEPGQIVKVGNYEAIVADDGTWSVTVPAADAGALSDGTFTITASVSDVAGNSASVSNDLLVDVTPPTLTINTLAADDVINAQELQQNLMITGSSTGVPAGGLVTVEIDGHSYTAAVDANGNWSVGVPSDVVSTLTDGGYTVTASVKDAAGNDGSVTHDVTVDTVSPVLTINTVAADDVINAIEKGETLTVSGTSDGTDGSTVTLNFNGTNYTATVSNGAWTLDVPATDVAKLGEADYTLTASSTDAAGNTGSTSHSVLVDSALPSVTISPVATDNVINSTEINADQLIGGKVTNAAAGDVVTITLGGNTYTATVQDDLSWSVSVPSADLKGFGDGDLTISASVTNQHGNTGSADRDIAIDAGLPGLRIDTVAGDDIVNSIEIQQNQIISGTSTDIAAGSSVTVTVNGVDYQATVGANGAWSAAVPAADVANWPAGALNISVTGSDTSGNSVTISNNVTVDLSSVAISVDTIAADDMINAAEKAADLTLSGSTQNVEAGQTVTVNFAGHTYTTTVQANGSWSVTVPAGDMTSLKDGDVTATASVTNVAGNSASAANTAEVDASAPTLTINTIAGDNVLNSAEAGADVVLSGTSTAEAGQVVTVTVNGNDYTATVGTDGTWSTSVPAADAAALTDGTYSVTATVKDVAGNSSSVTGSVLVDITAPVVSVNTVAGDDVINAAEHSQAQVITGGSTGTQPGNLVTLVIGGVSYSTVVDASGNWSVGVPADVIKGLASGENTISVSITDSAGNTGSSDHLITVNTDAVSLSIDTIAQDDIINAAEKGTSLTISGGSDMLATGTEVTVVLNGKSYTADVNANGDWTLSVPATDLAAIADGNYTVTASANDAAGNPASATHNVVVDATAPALLINPVTASGMLNAAELGQPLTLSGTSTAQAGQTVSVTLNNETYSTTVNANGTWTVNLPAEDVAALTDGTLTVTASTTDVAGNPVSANTSVIVDTVAPTLTINTIAGDDIINTTEQQAGQTISGTTSAEAGQIVTVTFNNREYHATVTTGGTWSLNVPAADFNGAADGSYTVTASVKDVAGNPAATDSSVSLSGAVPEITINTFAQDDVVSAAEHSGPLAITGTSTAAAGSTVTVTLNGVTYTTQVGSDQNWTLNLSANAVSALADGENYSITASVTNSIGNSGSASHDIAVDTTAPSMTITIDSVSDDTGRSTSDFVTSDNTLTLNGALSAALGNNESAQISLDGGVTWNTLTVTGTTWNYAQGSALADGSYTYNVRVIDAAGNVGSTASQTVVIDTVAPDASQTISIDAVSQDTGLSSSDFITSDTTLNLRGTLGAAPGADEYVQISLDGGTTWNDVSISGLTWTYIDGRTLTDGDYNYQMRVVDLAGNVGATASQVVTIDTTAPDSSKTVSVDAISSDTGLSSTDFVTSDTSLTVTGSLGATLAADEVVQVSTDGGLTWANATTIGTGWTFTDGRTLTDGDYTYNVRVVDTAGNVGNVTSKVVTVDTVAPDASKTVTIDSIATDTGSSASDFVTSDTSLTVTGSIGAELSPGEVVQISVDNGATWTTVTLQGSTWTYVDGRTLTDGQTLYQVRVVDQAGNVGQTAQQVVTIDTTAPTQIITIDAVSNDTGDSASDFITSDNTLTMTGSLSAALATDERAQISLDGGKTWTDVVVNGVGWSYDATGTVLADGNYNVQVRVIDQAGNVGTIGSQTVVIDTLNPEAVATIVQYSDDEGDRTGAFGSGTSTDETAPTLSGTLSKAMADGEVLKIYRNGVFVGVATVVGLAWTFSDSALADGTYVYVATSQDLAGNTTSSTDFTLKVDTSIPTTMATVTGESTQDTTPVISGTLSEALGEGMYVQVVVNGVTYTSETGGAVVVDPLNNTWYLQVPGALGLASYDVTAQVRSSAGNGNDAGISTSAIIVYAETAVDTSWASTAGATSTNAMAFSLNSGGLWNIVTGISDYSSSDLNSYAGTTLTNSRGNIVVSYTLADTDRNGTSDIYATETNYGGSIQGKWTANADGTYTYGQQAIGTTIWYGGVIAYDKTGDGWVDLAYGDAGGDSRSYLVNNNGVLSADGSAGAAGLAGVTYREISGIDINNDGTVDIVQHTNRNGAYALTVVSNNGTGTLSETQNIANVFVVNSADSTTAASMTWADFNGDGYMDLYISTGRNTTTSTNYGGVIYYNDGNGNLLTTTTQVEASTTSSAAGGYLSAAVDWDGDGDMDIIKFSTYSASQKATLYLNDGTGKGWSSSALASSLVNVTGIATLDYDWNGTQDLLVSQANGKVVYVANNSTIADGTAIHLRILDGEGMNVFYGNTVQLYNAAGELVASQIINAQSGIGINDASALVNFYGLDPNETYSAVLVRNINGVSSNATWTDLTAGDGTSSYSLTADAATGGNSGTITGTGYNDTFVAESGTYVYNGSGGWSTSSDHATWSATGGQDIVDYRNATSGITVDLSSSNAQNTGFNTSTFKDIEGIAGSDYDDVITGSAGDNLFEGRGGNDTFNLASGGHDTLLYKLLDSSDATGGNGSDTINGFTVGTWEGTANSDRLDLSDLLQSGGYTGTGSASYVNGVATLDASAGNITDYLSVTTEGNNTVIKVDMDGSGSAQSMTTIATLTNVHTDLATLLANHQLIVG